MPAYFDALLRYFEVSGRTTRSQYWLFQASTLLLGVIALCLDYQMSGMLDPEQPGLLVSFIGIFHFVPGITISVRRLHDTGRSGWWVLLYLVPVAGLFPFIWSFYGSDPGQNAYGPPYLAPERPTHRSLDIERALRRPGSGGNFTPAHLQGGPPAQRFI